MCAVSLTLMLAACSSKPTPRIVGKWARGNDLIFTFTKDGDLVRQEGASSETLGYSISGTTLFVKPKDQPVSLAYTISFPSQNELVLTPESPPAGQDSEPVQLTRVE